jgi:predicted ribosomally synthesized peptide with SipW-like signal peptide
MSSTKTKRYLVLLAAVGLVAAALGGTGTFASFNAETTNAGNYFATGTLLLSNKTPTQSACLSGGDAGHPGASGNVNNGCDVVLFGTNLYPGATAITGGLTIKNDGSIDASDLKLSTAGCTPSTDTTTVSGFNNGNLCNSVLMYVQEWTGSIGGTASHCWFGKDDGANTCLTNFAGATTAADSIATFATTYATPGADLSPSPLSGALPATTGTRYFTVGLYLPSAGAGDNAFQGLRATFPLTWHIDS